VIRESGGDRSAVTGGTRVVSDWLKVRVTAKPGESFLDRMIAMVEGAKRQKTPNEIALNILLVGLTITFLIVIVALQPFAIYAGTTLPTVWLIALLVTLIPTTIGALLSAIGIAGMDWLIQSNVVAKSGRAIEAAGNVDTLLIDKTGTITFGNRMADDFLPLKGVDRRELVEAAALASLSDETPEGRSIVELAKNKFAVVPDAARVKSFIPFRAETRISGAELTDGEVRKGAEDAILAYANAAPDAAGLKRIVEEIARSGGTPLVVAKDKRALGVVHLKDIVKPGIRERFADLRRMGIRTVMITGDNPLTAAAIAAEAGVDDFLAQATPEKKLEWIRKEQADGRMVAMCGDGTNDAPALAQADIGVAMNDGTQAAREAANIVDLDNDPTKLMDVVRIGKQLLISRGSLTTFSIANDVAKYFPGHVPHGLSGAGRLERHGAREPGERHPVRGDLQRADHRRSDSAGASGRRLPAAERRRAAAPKPADLRARRSRRALRRNQDHRRARQRRRPRLRGRAAMYFILGLLIFALLFLLLELVDAA
jgi:K+-transporting ATPase ATPase B chain